MATQLDIWTLIQQLTTDIPFTPEKIAHRLKVTLRQVSQTSAFALLEGGPVSLANGVVIRKIDLRVPLQGNHPGILVLSLAGHCITHQEKQAHYPQMTILRVPRPEQLASDGTGTVWMGTQKPWGKLLFAFPVAAMVKDCMTAIVLDPSPN